ncbi:two-partner secretion domain-containing protein [Pseudomonas sp. R151218B TE3479]
MDDRQHAFLARQPSAALKTRDAFWGMPKRGLAFLLANVMFWQPMWAQAGGIVVSAPGTSLGQAGNGVPVVNIAKPNGSGLSHNQFKDYNVGSNGVILNNATNPAQATQLGGIILGNPNLQGTAATTILNEVNGGNPSQLRGYTEVAGQSAHVIVANPYGISCNGCGFINTPKATLTTGKPIIENGQVGRYQVDQGSVAIEGAGLNANNVDRFEIITRSAKINAEIQAKNLTIVAGRNDVNAGTLNATARADDGSAKPELAIDSSALGGMYAGAIKLVGTEAGVGVKLDGKMVASGGDIQLDANGHLSLAQTTAAGAVEIKAQSLDAQGTIYAGSRVQATTQGTLSNQQAIAARENVTLTTDGQLNNLGIIEAGVNVDNTRNQMGDVVLTAASIDNRGQSVIASRDLKATTTQTLDNRGGTFSAGKTLTLDSKAIDNRAGTLVSQGKIQALATGTLDNRDKGIIASDGEQTLVAGTLKNSAGVISSNNLLKLEAKTLDNSGGKIASDAALTLGGGDAENSGGQITSQGDLVATLKSFNQQDGKLVSQGKLTLTADSIRNGDDGYIASVKAMSLTAHQQLFNTGKAIISTKQGLTISGGAVDNANGSLLSQGDLIVDITGDLVNQDGSVITQAGNVDVEASSLDNRGGVLASVDGWLKTTLDKVLNNGKSLTVGGDAGLIQAQSVKVGAEQAVFNNGGQVSALSGTAEITTATLENRSGAVLAKQALTVRAHDLDNSGGRVAADTIDFGLTGALTNQDGLVEGANGLLIGAASIDNQGGKLRSVGKLGAATLTVDQLLDNQSGVIEAATQDLSLQMAGFKNAGGNVRHVGTGTLAVDLARFSNIGGSLMTSGTLAVDAARWDNSSAIQANVLNLKVGQLNQTSTGKLIAVQSLLATGGTWNNAGTISSDADLDLQLTGAYVGTENSRVSGVNKFDLSAASLDLSSGSRLAGGGATTVTSLGALNNAGRITGGGKFSLAATSLVNTGTLGGADTVELVANEARNDRGLIFSGADMALRFNRFTNYRADVYSLGALNVAARDGVARSVLLENISGTLESAKDMSLRSDTLINRKDVFTTTDELVSGSISVKCYDCGGDHHNVDYIANETYQSVVLEDSASATLMSGAKLTVDGSAVTNQYSVMASAADLQITADNFANIGAASGTSVRTRTWNTGRVTDGTDERFRNRFIAPYNAQGNPKQVPVDALNSFRQVGDITIVTPGTSLAPAVVQSGGNISIQATQQLANSSVVQFQAPLAGTAKSAATDVANAAQPAVVVLNPQLPPDLAQQQVNPTTMPGFTLPTGENGLFRVVDSAAAAQDSHDQSRATVQGSDASRVITGPKYLIETNPALTDLKQFMSSDYLLGNLGYDPDTSWRRLGDGLYEQRLIQQAVLARTGQRFIAGQTSDEGMFKYLMNNAIASKDALDLAVGVTLTSQQVAALTHDIVWMEDQVVNGQHVLVPVLYLAQANNRLTADGALIQGKNLTLIAGTDLKNAGTLRASENLSAAAGNNLLNTRLAEAGERLKLVAGKDLVNMQGGILKGKDVELSTLTGDIRNDRTITTIENSGNGFSSKTSVVDNAARIEAGNNVSVQAAGDLLNVGGAITAGNDVDLRAGKDIVISAAREESGSMRKDKRHFWEQSQTVQHASEVQAGGDLNATAGNNLTVVASHLGAKGDINLSGNDVALISAANQDSSEYRYKRSGKKINKEEDHVSQQATTLTAGGDVRVGARNDLLMVASKIAAGNEAYLVAGKQLSLLAEQNRDYSLYDMKKKGSWGSKAARRDEVTQLTHVGSEITTGGDLILVSGGDQTYQVAKLQSGNALIIDSGGRITFEGVKDLHDESHTKSKSDLSWYKMKGEGRTDETLRQSALVAQGKLVIKAVDGLRIDVKQVDQQSVSQTIDAMVKAEPDLAWMKQAEARGDIDWRQVKEIHDSFKYENSGLGAGAKIAIAILMSFIMGPAGFGLSGANLAVATSLSTTAVTSTIDNKGNLGLALKETVSADSLKSAAIAGFTAGVLDYADKNWFASSDSASTTTQGVEPSAGSSGSAGSATSASNSSKDIFRWSNATDTAIRTTGRAVISSSISTAIGGGSFSSNFNAALLGEAGNVAMATGFNWVGDNIKFSNGGPQKIVAHAIMGGLLAELTGSDFKTGAVAAGLNEALIPGMVKVADGNEHLQLMLSQLTGLLAAAAVDGDLETGSKIAEKATTFNYLFHAELLEREQKLNTCASPADCQAVRDHYNNLDATRNREFGQYCQQNPTACLQVTKQLVDEIPANEKLLHDGRSAGLDRSAALWELTRSNERAINIGIIEKTRTEKGDGAAFLEELASDGLSPDRGLFSSTAGGKGGTTGVKVGVVGDGPKGGDNPVLGKPRVGSANKSPDGQHGFSDIIDNYAGDAAKFEIPTKGAGGEVVRVSELRQIEGSNNGVGGVFEWIVDEGKVTHRRFIPGGQVTGRPNQTPRR